MNNDPTLKPAPSSFPYPLRSAVRRGLAFVITAAGGFAPSEAMHLAATRVTPSKAFSAEETINSDQSLAAGTLFAAYAVFEDLYKGSLTMSKKADLVVLNRNPLSVSDAELASLEVMLTIN